jgi:3-phytase
LSADAFGALWHACLCAALTLAPTLALSHRGDHAAAADPPASQPLPALSVVAVGAAGTGDGDVHALGDGQWLVAAGNRLAFFSSGEETPLLAGHFESLDARRVGAYQGRPHILVSAVDADAGALRVLLVDEQSGSVAVQRELEADHSIPDTACLYREPDTGNISLLAVDARGLLEQRYVFNADTRALIDLPIRQEVAVLDAEACAAHDATGTVFLAEGPLGVWHLAASAETDATRTPAMLRAPWGSMNAEIEDLAVDAGGTLWVLLSDAGIVLRSSPSGRQSSYQLPRQVEATSISVRVSGDRTEVALFDEAGGQVLIAAWPEEQEALRTASALRTRNRIQAAAQTDPVRRYGDAADDPAIFVPADQGASPLILGTDKREGLAVYDLDGRQRQMLPVGRLNNVDLLADVELGGMARVIAAASNRSGNSIALFEITDGRVSHLAELPTTLDEVYGLCMYASASGVYVFINDTDGRYQQYRLAWRNNAPDADLVREFELPSQPEGCVADAQSRRLFMGEEAAGVWEASAEPDGDGPRMVIPLSDDLVADVEGMDIYRRETRDGSATRLLVVSSQGSDSYAVFDLDDGYNLVAAFSIGADLAAGIDGVSETDGLAVTSVPLPGYPRGLLVVQDGRNRMPDAPQNFKLIDWRAIEALIAGGAATAPVP